MPRDSTTALSVAYAAFIAWLYSTQPKTVAEVTGGLSSTVGAYQIDAQAMSDGLAFFPNGGGDRFLRLPYCALSPAEIDDGIGRLAETVREVRAA